MAKTNGVHGKQAFRDGTAGNVPEGRKGEENREVSEPVRRAAEAPREGETSERSPADRPAVAHTPAPWFVEHTATAGLRVVHGEPDQHGFRDDVPFGLGKLSPTPLELANNRVKAAAPQLLDSLLAVEWGGECQDDDGDPFACCPNCFAPANAETGDPDGIEGVHYAHCELRDSLDAALGVTSERIVHPAHAGKEAARG